MNMLRNSNRFDSLNAIQKESKEQTVKNSKYEIVNELSQGDYFGEISLLTKYLKATATIRAISDSV